MLIIRLLKHYVSLEEENFQQISYSLAFIFVRKNHEYLSNFCYVTQVYPIIKLQKFETCFNRNDMAIKILI